MGTHGWYTDHKFCLLAFQIGIGSLTQTPCTRLTLHWLLCACAQRKMIIGERGSMTRISSPLRLRRSVFLLTLPYIEPANPLKNKSGRGQKPLHAGVEYGAFCRLSSEPGPLREVGFAQETLYGIQC